METKQSCNGDVGRYREGTNGSRGIKRIKRRFGTYVEECCKKDERSSSTSCSCGYRTGITGITEKVVRRSNERENRKGEEEIKKLREEWDKTRNFMFNMREDLEVALSKIIVTR